MKHDKIGFTTVTFRKKTPEEICRLAVQNGINILEWGTDVHVPNPKAAREVRALCDRYELTTVSLGAYHRIGGENPTPFSETIESAKILGAGRIRVWLGTKSSVLFTEKERAALLEETKALAREAGAQNIEIAFEFHRKTMNDTGESSLAFLNALGELSVSTYWQPFFHETPEKDFLFADDRDNLLKVLPHISAVHVFSWDEAAHRFPFAYHKDAWREFLAVLEESPCEELIMEFVKDDSETQFAEDLAMLKTLLSH